MAWVAVLLVSLLAHAESGFMGGGSSIHVKPAIPVKPPASLIVPPRPVPPGSAQCSTRTLLYKGNGVPEVPPEKPPVLWGGSATYSGDSALLQPAFWKKALAAKGVGHHTMMYLEGPCGQTGGSDPDDEIGKCRRKFQAYNANHPTEASGIADDTSTRWRPYTIAQLKESVKYKIDHCEIDNMDNSDGLIKFLRVYKTLYDQGQIYCRLVLKNLNEDSIGAIGKAFGTGPAVDFISTLHIKEVGGNGCNSGRGDYSEAQNSANAALRRLKGPGAQTVLSRDTCIYESSNFSQESFLSCPGGRVVSQQGAALVPEAEAGR